MAPCQVLTRGLLLWRIKHSSTAAALVQEDVEVPLTYLEDFPKTDLKYGETMISLPRGQSGKIISTKERKTGRVSSIMFEQEDGQQGGCKLVYQTTKKRASGPKCPVTGKRIQGLEEVEPNKVMLIWMLFGNSGRVTLQNLFMFRPGYIRQ